MGNAPESSAGDSASWAPGGIVGDYRLLSRLGGGGMGVVFAAAHSSTGARHALKVLLTSDPDLRARFRREAEAMARTDRHPNVVRVHSVGEHRGRPYIAMEHLTGGDLAERLRGGPLPPAEAVAVVRALCGGLAHVHAMGVLHRDLKPANVMFDDTGCPKLVDFGLARGPTDGALTRTGEVVGTPSFMAPEQAEGRRGAQDERTDVYGLGAVLYAALSGRPPFEGTSLIAVLERVTREPPSPPSAFAPGLPRALDAVCLRALAKRPEDRFASATELGQALEQASASPARGGAARALVAALGGLAAASTLAVALMLRPPGPPVVVPIAGAAPLVTSAAAAPEPPPQAAPSMVEPTTPPATVAAIPFPPATLPPEVREQLGDLIYFELDDLPDPASGVAVAVARELVRPDPLMAARYLRFAAERSPDPEWSGMAWIELGKLFEKGRGVAKNDAEALECYRRSARTGHPAGLIKVAEAQARGWWSQPTDLPAAVETYRAALRAGQTTTLDPGWVREQVGFGLARIALHRPGLVSVEEIEPLLSSSFDHRKEARLLLARLRAELKQDAAGALEIYEELIERDDHPEAHARRALLLLPAAPERLDELLAGPTQPQRRAAFAWHLWDEGKEVAGVRPRAIELLRRVIGTGDPHTDRYAALCLGRIFVDERMGGREATTPITEDEARRYLELAAKGEGEVGAEARGELEKLRRR